jgi:hypothetical protein
MALYVLAGREQKSPYLTISVYQTVAWVIFSMLLGTVAVVLNKGFGRISHYFQQAAWAFFIIGLLSVFWRILQAHNRRVHLRDDKFLANTSPYRACKTLKNRFLKPKPPKYEYNPGQFPQSLISTIERIESMSSVGIDQIIKTNSHSIGGKPFSISGFLRPSSIKLADTVLIDLAWAFIQVDCFVQYTGCIRHPIEFASKLKDRFNGSNEKVEWRKATQQIILVDAFSPHFGFVDSVHKIRTDSLKEEGLFCVDARASYAGLHSAAAKGFNEIKSRTKMQGQSAVRQPTLLIYEGAYALSDLESIEQYRVFVRHTLSSERLWGGMFSIFCEYGLSDRDVDLFLPHADFFLGYQVKDKNKLLAQSEA